MVLSTLTELFLSEPVPGFLVPKFVLLVGGLRFAMRTFVLETLRREFWFFGQKIVGQRFAYLGQRE